MVREFMSKQSASDVLLRNRRAPNPGCPQPRKKQTARRFEPAGRPVVCLGLTKRWSLYVASHGNSRVWD